MTNIGSLGDAINIRDAVAIVSRKSEAARARILPPDDALLVVTGEARLSLKHYLEVLLVAWTTHTLTVSYPRQILSLQSTYGLGISLGGFRGENANRGE